MTTSLRGAVGGLLTVQVLTEGVHSGAAGGIVPSSFRILRALLERLENAETGALAAPLYVAIPDAVRREAAAVAQALGDLSTSRFPWAGRTHAGEASPRELVLANGDRYRNVQFAVTGVLGPKSNAHGPNEFLHIDCAKRVTACIAHLLGACANV